MTRAISLVKSSRLFERFKSMFGVTVSAEERLVEAELQNYAARMKIAEAAAQGGHFARRADHQWIRD